MSVFGICLETGLEAIQSILSCMQTGVPVCVLNYRWPAVQINRELEKLKIQEVLTDRTDLRAKKADIALLARRKHREVTIKSLHHNATTILHTSGSSDEPKAVVHSLENHLFSAERAISKLHLRSTDRWLLRLPLWHVSGMSIVFRCLVSGAEIIIPDPQISLFEALSSQQITHVSIVGAQLIQLLDKSPPLSLRAVIVGGGPTPPHHIAKALDQGWPILTTYGMTETSSMITLSDHTFPIGSSGRLLEGNELKFTDDGEILLRSPAVCSGYLHELELQSVTDEDGWLHSGDIGYMDESGELYIMSRKDNMFISGGENISPEEIENVLLKYNGVEEAIVVPIPDAKFGQRPVAFIQGSTDNQNLTQFLADHLPKFKIPICYPWPNHVSQTSIKRDRKLFTNIATRLHDSES